ncbi:MAG: response regulator transcription factor [Gammaproteobacteria bacterium]|nr:response regulator transcription factor [Gammaproteobacteria bacterium]
MKILHVDEQTLFRAGMCCILEPLDDDLTFLEAGDLPTAMNTLDRHDDIDLVLWDLCLTGPKGCAELKVIVDRHPAVPLVVLSASQEPERVKEAIASGAAGYIPKSTTRETLLNALRIVLDGGIYAPRMLSHRPAHDGPSHRKPAYSSLTRRQSEVLALMSEGLPNKLIARELFVSEATVKGHVTAILGILGVNNRVQAINKAREIDHRLGAMNQAQG